LKIVIIGNSAAGLSAAETIRRFDANAGLTIITDEIHSPYLRCLIPEVLAGAKSLSDIFYKSSDFYDKHNVLLLRGNRANAISPGIKKVLLEDGQEVSYDRLLIATGAKYFPIGIKNDCIGNIFTLRTYDHALAAAKSTDSANEAVVIGAGLVGLNAAVALKRKGLKVTVVEAEPHLLINQLDYQSAVMVEKELLEESIKFVFGTRPRAFVPRSGINSIAALSLDNGKEIPAEIAIVSTGVRPNVELVENAGGRAGAGIVVDDFLRTSIGDVYAAGDCMEIKDAASKEVIRSGLWPLAIEQGRFAAYNILGMRRSYPLPLARMNACQFGRIPVISLGIINPGRGDECLTYEDPGHKVYRRLFFKDDILTGCILLGDVNGSGIYTDLIKRKIPVANLKHKLIKGAISFADVMKLR
jgi:nitrite reductase (NADH) large subunit